MSEPKQQPAERTADEHVACRNCNGTGRMVRDPDIGTDQECFACDGSGIYEETRPRRKWIGLTTEEIYECDEKAGVPNYEITNADMQAFAFEIEAKLREKNWGTND